MHVLLKDFDNWLSTVRLENSLHGLGEMPHIEWYERGLGEMPIGVVTETNEYLTNADEFSLWLEEFTKPEVGVNTPVARLYESWKEFQNNYGTPLSMLDTRRVFKEKMRMKGFVEDRTATSRIYKDVLYLDPSEGGTTLCSQFGKKIQRWKSLPQLSKRVKTSWAKLRHFLTLKI